MSKDIKVGDLVKVIQRLEPERYDGVGLPKLGAQGIVVALHGPAYRIRLFEQPERLWTMGGIEKVD